MVRGLESSESGFPCCRMPSVAPQECSVEPDKGKARDLVVWVVLQQQRGPLTCDLPWEEQQLS